MLWDLSSTDDDSMSNGNSQVGVVNAITLLLRKSRQYCVRLNTRLSNIKSTLASQEATLRKMHNKQLRILAGQNIKKDFTLSLQLAEKADHIERKIARAAHLLKGLKHCHECNRNFKCPESSTKTTRLDDLIARVVRIGDELRHLKNESNQNETKYTPSGRANDIVSNVCWREQPIKSKEKLTETKRAQLLVLQQERKAARQKLKNHKKMLQLKEKLELKIPIRNLNKKDLKNRIIRFLNDLEQLHIKSKMKDDAQALCYCLLRRLNY